MAWAGAAESTAMPASNRIDHVGSPRPSQMAPRAPGPRADSEETRMAFSNVCCT